ncbi:Translation elongation factor Ts [Elusimicrobium minutum Pei191]|uniref:Elongation factor Ts n=1 Tax=Elusimicrobium minutum (strain Pei191) TaxID=445932 RepID=B2KC77_ELUMP|nr:translation elongation factor Ts [Elusimicrobium minutum]ACC98204.1 Translation elongation factor Ts [Elusimicrobium minutum Pei191]
MSLAEDIKNLREKTGAGLMDCKKALEECKGDIEAAITVLRKKGLASMAKRAGRETKEGQVVVKNDGKHYAMTFLGCETDFVARTDDFKKLAAAVCDYVLANPGLNYDEDQKIKDMISEVAPKLGENVSLKGAYNWEVSGKCGVIETYVHSDNKKAAMLELACVNGDGSCCNSDKVKEIARGLAMHSVGMQSMWLDEADIPADVIAKEQEIYKELALKEGKDEASIEKMMPGKVKKFAKDNCLLEQGTIKDNKVSVRQHLADCSKELGFELKVVRFVRF